VVIAAAAVASREIRGRVIDPAERAG